MKKFMVTTTLLIGMAGVAGAQCDKTLKLDVEKIYTVGPDNSEGKNLNAGGTVTISRDSIHVIMLWDDGNSTDVKGLIKKTECKMNADYSEGFIDIVADAVLSARGNSKSDKMFFTVVSSKGAMKIYGVPESDINDKLCFVIKNREVLKN